MKINQVAKLTGTTVRTLHYYDEIGLLKPNASTETGYRIYDHENLEKLQQILFFKELNFPLNDIKAIMDNPSYDKNEALMKQREWLIEKKERLNALIALIDQSLKGECHMNFKAFDQSEMERHKKAYADEVKEKWGRTSAYSESQSRTSQYTPEDWEKIQAEAGAIFSKFASNLQKTPDSKEVQALVKEWQDHISKYYYTCSKEILAGLGQMYRHDERFAKNMDQVGQGTAAFMADAIEVYCEKHNQ